MLHYAPYQTLHHCSATKMSVVSPYKEVLYGAFIPLQDGALLPNKTVLYCTSPLQDGALCPGYETVLNPRTTQPFPRLQTKHWNQKTIFCSTQTRIKSTIESRSHDCNPVMFCIKHWCPLMTKLSQPLYARQVCVHTMKNAIKPFLGSAPPIVNAWL